MSDNHNERDLTFLRSAIEELLYILNHDISANEKIDILRDKMEEYLEELV